MNAVEIEEAVSSLAEQPFDAESFPFAFLEAFGNKETTIRRLKAESEPIRPSRRSSSTQRRCPHYFGMRRHSRPIFLRMFRYRGSFRIESRLHSPLPTRSKRLFDRGPIPNYQSAFCFSPIKRYKRAWCGTRYSDFAVRSKDCQRDPNKTQPIVSTRLTGKALRIIRNFSEGRILYNRLDLAVRMFVFNR